MIEIEAKGYEDEQFDGCGNTTHAVLKVNGIKIPLCDTCIEELTESLAKFNNTVFCHKCEKFIMSPYGWNYGGSCTKDGEIKPENVGYINCKSCMDTCKEAVPKDKTKNVSLDVNLEEFRYSLIGDGYIKEEVIKMSDEKLIEILQSRVYFHILSEYNKGKEIGCF